MRSSSGPGDRVGEVRGGDEDDLGEVELHVEVVVAERVVLRRIEHLEQRRGGVAAPVGADLVDLVEHDHGVHRPGVAQRADEPARQGADVRAPVAADLGLVADAAERHADELAAERAGDRLADGGLAGAGRADQGQDGAGALVLGDAALLPQLAHGQVLDDAVLHVVEAVVVGVEDLARVRRVEPLLGALRPRHGEQPVEVGADDRRPRAICSPMRSRRPSSRSACSRTASGMPASAIFARYSSTTEPSSSPSSLRIESICGAGGTRAAASGRRTRRRRGCGGAPAARPGARAGGEGELSRSRTSSGLEQLDLLLEREVGRVAGRVGQGAGLGDRADEGRDAAVVAAQLEDLLDDRAVLALELATGRRGVLVVGSLLDLDAQRPSASVWRGAGDAAVQAGQGDGADAAGQATASATSATTPTFA